MSCLSACGIGGKVKEQVNGVEKEKMHVTTHFVLDINNMIAPICSSSVSLLALDLVQSYVPFCLCYRIQSSRNSVVSSKHRSHSSLLPYSSVLRFLRLTANLRRLAPLSTHLQTN